MSDNSVTASKWFRHKSNQNPGKFTISIKQLAIAYGRILANGKSWEFHQLRLSLKSNQRRL